MRPEQSYKGVDAAGLCLRLLRDVGIPEAWVLEGGVWQSNRMLHIMQTLGIELINAKGNPQKKQVECFFNRLQTRLSIEPGHVGRFYKDYKLNQDLYCKCREGREDPRKHFPGLHESLQAIDKSIIWINSEPIESRVHGRWIPTERWMHDMEESPRQKLEGDWLWMAAPVLESRTVFRNHVKVTAPNALGISVQWHFASRDLYRHEGQVVDVYFDPLSPAPVEAVITQNGKELCRALSIDSHEGGMSAADATQHAKAIRQSMRSEYRSIMPNERTGRGEVVKSESSVRGAGSLFEITRNKAPELERAPARQTSTPIRTADFAAISRAAETAAPRIKAADFAALTEPERAAAPRVKFSDFASLTQHHHEEKW
jgi:hypothetical protein